VAADRTDAGGGAGRDARPDGDEDGGRRGRSRAAAEWRGASARSDARGRFLVAGLEGGRYELRVRTPGYADFTSAPFELRVGESHALDVQLDPELTITGTVFSADGDPIGAAEVYLVPEPGSPPWSGQQTLTSLFGTYRLGRLRPGTYDLRVIAAGFASSFVDGAEAGSRRVDVILERPASLSGQVLTPGGQPLAEPFRVRLRADDAARLARVERERLRRWQRFADPQGRFRIDRLPPGTYRVVVDAPGYAPPAAEVVVTLPRAAGTQAVVVTLGRRAEAGVEAPAGQR
jgi:hypothetical protein